MFRRSRLVMVLALLALLAIIAPTFAQEETYGLSAEDYALLTSANGQTMGFNSLTFDFLVDGSVAGVPGSEGALKLNGTGALDTALSALQVTMTGSLDANGESQAINIELRVVENVIYYNLGDGNGWVGQRVEDAMGSLESMSSMLPVDPAALASGDMSSDPAASEAMMGAMSALSSINPADYISMSRLGDENNNAHFSINLDIAGFLSSPAFTQLMTAAGTAAGPEATGGMDMAQMAPMLSMMFQDVKLAFDQWIGVEDQMIHRGLLDFGLTINPAMMGGGTDATPVTVAFKLDVSNMTYNTPVIVEVPEGAVIANSAS